jgi:uncharacterized protein (DUF1800 family)
MKHSYKLRALALIGVMLAGGSVQSAFAQALADNSPAALWRVSSRLGYGPSAQLVQNMPASAKSWALQQLDAAQQASQRPAVIPEPLKAIGMSANEATRLYQEERESRRQGRIQAAAQMAAPGMADQSAALNPAAPALASEPENFSRDMQQGIASWRLAACSNSELENPLLARMTEFWFNHFNVYVSKGTVRPFVASYVFHAIRPHALGKFEDMVLATAQHPAMLMYLDQAQSKANGLNENYARELMELHTLGVSGGYTQADVRELARILTGWSVNIAGGQAFVFGPRGHDGGEKVLMGQRFTSSGQQQGIEAIRFLARHPATAQRISERLATFFIADKPSKAVVDRLAKSFQQSGGDIKTVMRSLMESPEFWESGNTLFKTPMDYACSALTATGQAKERANALQNLRQSLGFLNQTGQGLHQWQTPDGYKTDAGTWLAPEALTRRADYAFGLAPRVEEPSFLQTFYSAATRDRIAKETAVNTRTGLLLAAPEFMTK